MINTPEHVRRRVVHSRDRFWEPADFGDENRRTVLRTLGNLADAGELVRIRRGLYWRGTSDSKGMSRPSALAAVERIVGKGVGPGSFSAAHFLGLSKERPPQEIIAVPERPPREMRGVKFLSRAGRGARKREELSLAEVALLEVLETPAILELSREQAEEKVWELFRDRRLELRPENLVRAAAGESAICREGLRNALTAAGFEEESDRIPRSMSQAVRQAAFLA